MFRSSGSASSLRQNERKRSKGISGIFNRAFFPGTGSSTSVTALHSPAGHGGNSGDSRNDSSHEPAAGAASADATWQQLSQQPSLSQQVSVSSGGGGEWVVALSQAAACSTEGASSAREIFRLRAVAVKSWRVMNSQRTHWPVFVVRITRVRESAAGAAESRTSVAGARQSQSRKSGGSTAIASTAPSSSDAPAGVSSRLGGEREPFLDARGPPDSDHGTVLESRSQQPFLSHGSGPSTLAGGIGGGGGRSPNQSSQLSRFSFLSRRADGSGVSDGPSLAWMDNAEKHSEASARTPKYVVFQH